MLVLVGTNTTEGPLIESECSINQEEEAMLPLYFHKWLLWVEIIKRELFRFEKLVGIMKEFLPSSEREGGSINITTTSLFGTMTSIRIRKTIKIWLVSVVTYRKWHNGPLAQSAERGANNAKVMGSSPIRTNSSVLKRNQN